MQDCFERRKLAKGSDKERTRKNEDVIWNSNRTFIAVVLSSERVIATMTRFSTPGTRARRA